MLAVVGEENRNTLDLVRLHQPLDFVPLGLPPLDQ